MSKQQLFEDIEFAISCCTGEGHWLFTKFDTFIGRDMGGHYMEITVIRDGVREKYGLQAERID